jgi:hypothetical protein
MSDESAVASMSDPASALTVDADAAIPQEDIEEEDEEEEEEEEEAEGGGTAPDYGSVDYWDDRYLRCPEPFDWYQTWPHLTALLALFFDGQELALNVGCGNSPMAVDMSASFHTVVNIDISAVVIAQMERDHQDKSNILWFTMDCMRMEFDDDTFDVAFDKGTIDALLCVDSAIEKVGRTLAEVHEPVPIRNPERPG